MKVKLLVVLLTLLAGCIATPEYTDPLVSMRVLTKKEGPLVKQSLRVLVSENTEKALKHLADTANKTRFLNPRVAGELDPRSMVDGLKQVLAGRFRSVVVTGVSETDEQKTDLTMILDVRVVLGQWSGQTSTVELLGIFMDPDQQLIETVSGKGTSTVPSPASSIRFREAASSALDDFAKHLDNNAKLAAFASSRIAKAAGLTSSKARPNAAPPPVPKLAESFSPKVEGPAPPLRDRERTGRPEVTINYPEDRVKIAAEALILAGIVRSPNSLARVSIAVNGNELPTSGGLTRSPAGTTTLPLSIRIPLQFGENVIVLTAFDQSGEAGQAVRTVYREAALPSGQIQEAARPIPGGSMERWAVVIGIDRYRDPSITELQYAVADANAFYDFLITKGGVKPSNARLLLNKDATQVNIRRALGDFLKQKALKDDEVIIYYAGHGTTDPEPTAEGGLAKYLVPWDADPTSLFATGIPMEEIDHIFARLAARKILLVQDTCFSGGAGGRTFVRRGLARATTLTDKFLQDLASRQGRMVLTASDANQLSLESPELRHGLFTHYLLQALGGAADLDSDGAITTREVHLYLQRKVHEHSGGNQTPQLYSVGDMVIVRVK